MQPLSQNTYLLTIMLACCWGPSFMFIKIALPSLSPLLIVQQRLILAAIILYVYIKIKKIALPQSYQLWWHCTLMGVFAAALPFTLFCIAEMYIDSAMAGIVNGLTPIFAVILAHFFLKSESITVDRLLGVLFGLIGFCFLLLPTVSDYSIDADSMSIVLVAIASLSYAVGMVYGKIYLPKQLNLGIPAAQIICAALVLLPFTLFFEISHMDSLWKMNSHALFAVIFMAILGTVFAFIIYYRILEFGGAVILAMAVYLLPLFSIFLGVIFLHEHLHVTTLFGTGMIILGMVFANGAIKLKQFWANTLKLRP